MAYKSILKTPKPDVEPTEYHNIRGPDGKLYKVPVTKRNESLRMTSSNHRGSMQNVLNLSSHRSTSIKNLASHNRRIHFQRDSDGQPVFSHSLPDGTHVPVHTVEFPRPDAPLSDEEDLAYFYTDADLEWFQRDMGLTVQLYNRSQSLDLPWDDHDSSNGSMRGLEETGIKGHSTLKKMQLRRKHTLSVLEAQHQARQQLCSPATQSPATSTRGLNPLQQSLTATLASTRALSFNNNEEFSSNSERVFIKLEHEIAEASRRSSKGSAQRARELAKKDEKEVKEFDVVSNTKRKGGFFKLFRRKG